MHVTRFLILFFMLIWSWEVVAQNDSESKMSFSHVMLSIDSLENLLPQATDVKKPALMLEIAELYRVIDAESAAVYAKKAIQLKGHGSDTLNISQAYILLSDFHFDGNRYDSAFFFRQMAMREMGIESQKDKNKLLTERLMPVRSSNNTFILVLYIAIVLFLLGLVVTAALFYKSFFRKKKLIACFLESKNQYEKQVNKVGEFKQKVEHAVTTEYASQTEKLDKIRHEEIELRKQLKRVEEADYLKNAFLGSLSHEIRTPLSGIVGFTSLLQTELAVLGSTELYEYTTSIEQSSQQLTSLLNNIVDISSIEANMVEVELHLDRFNNIVKEVQETYSQRAKEKGLVFKVKIDPELPKLKADSIKLKKVLHILVDNAVKFTDKGFVTITTAYNAERNMALIQTRDTGKGIDAETLRLLLLSFQYGQQDASKIYQGKGIGLTLAYRFVTMMGGSLSISSHEEKGTTVTLAIPCVGAKTNEEMVIIEPEKTVASIPDLGQISLFIVEDDRMNRLVLEKMLKNVGNITMAVDGEDALMKVEKAYNKKDIFDVMLFDMQLPPPWDGISLMTKIKELMPEYKTVPFIVQTAFAMGGDKNRYLDAGFDDYIAKPIEKTELLTMIKKNLEFHRST